MQNTQRETAESRPRHFAVKINRFDQEFYENLNQCDRTGLLEEEALWRHIMDNALAQLNHMPYVTSYDAKYWAQIELMTESRFALAEIRNRIYNMDCNPFLKTESDA